MDFNDGFFVVLPFFVDASDINAWPFASSPNDIRSIRLVSLSRLSKLLELLSDAKTVSARFVLNRWRLNKHERKATQSIVAKDKARRTSWFFLQSYFVWSIDRRSLLFSVRFDALDPWLEDLCSDSNRVRRRSPYQHRSNSNPTRRCALSTVKDRYSGRSWRDSPYWNDQWRSSNCPNVENWRFPSFYNGEKIREVHRSQPRVDFRFTRALDWRSHRSSPSFDRKQEHDGWKRPHPSTRQCRIRWAIL